MCPRWIEAMLPREHQTMRPLKSQFPPDAFTTLATLLQQTKEARVFRRAACGPHDAVHVCRHGDLWHVGHSGTGPRRARGARSGYSRVIFLYSTKKWARRQHIIAAPCTALDDRVSHKSALTLCSTTIYEKIRS